MRSLQDWKENTMLHKKLENYQIILASSSPRRANILKQLGLKFEQISPEIDEDIFIADPQKPNKYVERIAVAKFMSVLKSLQEVPGNRIIIGLDTIVYLEDTILGKPKDSKEAYEFLKKLSGKTHIVYTGFAGEIVKDDKTNIFLFSEKTSVKFSKITDEEIYSYIETKEPLDKAGAYGIQGYGSQFIEKINGCYFNVMGFPVNLFYKLIRGKI